MLNHRQLASSQSLLGQLWKEYALSDSRYLTSDTFTLCVEAITVVRLQRVPESGPASSLPLVLRPPPPCSF